MNQNGPQTLYKHKYGLTLTRRLSDANLELYCFLNDRSPEEGGLGKAGHFRRFVEITWGPGSKKEFVWHPWAERMLEEACRQKYLGIIGCGNSSKTSFGAIWAIVNWLASRWDTKVMVTSTSLKESRKRIWGAIVEYFIAAQLPGNLVDSMGIIRNSFDENEITSDKCGIELIPGEKRKEKEAIGKLIGIKARRVIMICDELPELSEALLSASFSNLALNPNFQLIGIGNFASMYDPLGIFVAPSAGWHSVTTDDEQWETKLHEENGLCLRFDGMKSPNIISGRDEWPMIYTSKDLANHRRTLGETTALFWRMCRSFPCPEGEQHVIFSEADLVRGDVHGQVVWLTEPIPIAAIDPSFTSGGDQTVVITGLYGKTRDGIWTIYFDKFRVLQEDISLKDTPRNRQIALQFIDICIEHKVNPQHAAYDSSGPGGIMFGELVGDLWSGMCLGVNFGGAPSELPISDYDTRVAKEAYINRVSELWHVALEFVINNQIKNLPNEVAVDWKARRYNTKKLGMIKSQIESKADMRLRTNRSPDAGDTGVILITLCRERLGAIAGAGNPQSPRGKTNWVENCRRFDQVYDTEAEFEYDGVD